MNCGTFGNGGLPARRLVSGLSAAALMLVMAACGNAPTGDKKADSGAAGLTTMDADKMGERIKAARGTVVVVNVWATWCPPCVAEMPEFARFYAETKRPDVTFISVCANAPDTISAEVKPFLEKNKITFSVSVLSNADPVTIGKATGAEVSGAMPLTLVYDRAGKLQKMLEESVTFDSLMALVKPLL
jgi:thiol-disulfide isomerase/thioredoxin